MITDFIFSEYFIFNVRLEYFSLLPLPHLSCFNVITHYFNWREGERERERGSQLGLTRKKASSVIFHQP